MTLFISDWSLTNMSWGFQFNHLFYCGNYQYFSRYNRSRAILKLLYLWIKQKLLVYWHFLPESFSSMTAFWMACNQVNVSLKHSLQTRLHRIQRINGTRSQGALKNHVQLFYWGEHYQNSYTHALESNHSKLIITVNRT